MGFNERLNFVNIYAPNSSNERKVIWKDLVDIKNEIQGYWIFMGDFNDVRRKEDRLSEFYCESSTAKFNEFIRNADLAEFNMGGRRYTWISKDGRKFSKLDRFLVCKNFLAKWCSASVIALPRQYFDHNPIILIGEHLDFGPCPFRFYNSWLSMNECKDIVSSAWSEDVGVGRHDVILLRKLKKVKENLKKWRSSCAETEKKEFTELKKAIEKFELEAESGQLSPNKYQTWKSNQARLLEIETRRKDDLKQKARIK